MSFGVEKKQKIGIEIGCVRLSSPQRPKVSRGTVKKQIKKVKNIKEAVIQKTDKL